VCYNGGVSKQTFGLYWAVVNTDGTPCPPGISRNRTLAIRRFLYMPENTPPGSGRAEQQRREWAFWRKKGWRLGRVEIRPLAAQP